MTFTWPLALLLVVAVPIVLAAYLVAMRRRRKQALSYSSVALLRSVLPRRSRWRRHLPLAMLLASIGVLALASARPQMNQNVPVGRTSIILALDVSLSMCATDVDPNRLTVAQQAARDFVESQPSGTRIGLVVFSGSAQLPVPPTTDHTTLVRTIDGLTTGRGTAIGVAMLKSLNAVAEVNPDVLPVGDAALNDDPDSLYGGTATAPPRSPPAAPGGGYVPDIVVLLTDGANTRGIAPLDAVAYAVERRVRIYTIAFGTTQPASLACSSQQLGGSAPSVGVGGGRWGDRDRCAGRSPLRADTETLQKVADQTGGAAYAAEDASQLSRVFADLPKDVTVQKRQREVTSSFVALGALLAAAAMAASIRWSAHP